MQVLGKPSGTHTKYTPRRTQKEKEKKEKERKPRENCPAIDTKLGL